MISQQQLIALDPLIIKQCDWKPNLRKSCTEIFLEKTFQGFVILCEAILDYQLIETD